MVSMFNFKEFCFVFFFLDRTSRGTILLDGIKLPAGFIHCVYGRTCPSNVSRYFVMAIFSLAHNAFG